MSKGIVRNIDSLGRIVIPKEIRDDYKMFEGSACEVVYTEEGILLRHPKNNAAELKNAISIINMEIEKNKHNKVMLIGLEIAKSSLIGELHE